MAPRATRGWRMCSRIEQQASGQILVKRKLNASKLEPAMALGTETGGCAARLGAVCRKRPLLAFYVLTLVISWAFWIPVTVSHQALIPFWPSTLFLIFGSFGPSLSAVILAAMKSGGISVRGFGGLPKWRVGVRWYLLALLLPAALCFSAVALHVFLGGSAPQLYSPVPWYPLPVYFLVVLLFVGPMTAEIGWRWYALPIFRLIGAPCQRARSSVGSSWALWHLPLAWTGETSWPGLPFPLFTLAIIALTMLFA